MQNNKKSLILIVDDTPQNIQVLGNILYEKGYNISISSSGEQALQSVTVQAPDLILLDIQMPGMDGYEVCQALKSNPQTKHIPIIFLTAVSESENIIRGFELGAVDYITKPFNVAELTARVSTHIELKLSREKLVELNSTKDKFFSIIAHDLRNPFSGLLSSSVMLKRCIAKKDMINIEKYAEFISISSKSAYALLENLLNWARLQMNNFEVKKEKFNVNAFVNDALTEIVNIAKEKSIDIEVTGNEKADAFFDKEMFKALIRNFATNAVKFSTKEKNIIVEITDYNDTHHLISFKDKGVGISKEDIQKLFRIDVSYSNQGTNGEKGTGLGLILCKDFAEKNGSEIFIESEVDKGSTFSFTAEKFKE